MKVYIKERCVCKGHTFSHRHKKWWQLTLPPCVTPRWWWTSWSRTRSSCAASSPCTSKAWGWRCSPPARCTSTCGASRTPSSARSTPWSRTWTSTLGSCGRYVNADLPTSSPCLAQLVQCRGEAIGCCDVLLRWVTQSGSWLQIKDTTRTVSGLNLGEVTLEWLVYPLQRSLGFEVPSI